MILSILLLSFLSSDLDAVKAEPVLEKRAQRSLDFASERLTEARKTYEAGDDAAFTHVLTQVAESVEYCLFTLEEIGKHPSRNVRQYKPSEMRVRELLRRLVTLRNDASMEMRPAVIDCEKRLAAVHDALLNGVMSRKPRS